jgi:aminomethyltransferase
MKGLSFSVEKADTLPRRTALFKWHSEAGARIIEFAGYEMPVWYTSQVDEHKMVRTKAGAFDLSHMGELFFRGPEALNRLQYLTTNNVAKLEVGEAQYSLMPNERGGLHDDVIVYHVGPEDYMVVVNAANHLKVVDHITQVFGSGSFEDRSYEITLIALQGPKAAEILGKLIPEKLADYKPFSVFKTKIENIPVTIARTGYTGEDGFEIFVEDDKAIPVWQAVLKTGDSDVVPVGLAARDTLRLEVCYSLYGNEIDEDCNPFAARVGWVIKLKKGDFIGRDALTRMKDAPMKEKLVGLEQHTGPVPRHGLLVYQGDKQVGRVTSGCLSPMSGKRVALAYVPMELSEVGTTLQIEQRGRMSDASIVEIPFYKREAQD